MTTELARNATKELLHNSTELLHMTNKQPSAHQHLFILMHLNP